MLPSAYAGAQYSAPRAATIAAEINTNDVESSLSLARQSYEKRPGFFAPTGRQQLSGITTSAQQLRVPREIEPESAETRHLRDVAWQWAEPVLDTTRKKASPDLQLLIDDLKRPINEIVELNTDKTHDEVQELVRNLILKRARDLIEYYRMDLHDLKDIFAIADYQGRAADGKPMIVRLRVDDAYVWPGKAKEDVIALTDEEKQPYRVLQELKTLLRNNEGKLNEIFEKNIRTRYILKYKPPFNEVTQRTNAYRDAIIHKLLYETNLDMVRGAVYLFPGLDDVLVHASASIDPKREFDTAGKYRVRIGEVFLREMMKPENQDTLLRVMLEATLRFDSPDENGLRRDEKFWREAIVPIAKRLQPMETTVPPGTRPQRIERVFRQALMLHPDEARTPGGLTEKLFLLFYQCFPELQKIMDANPDASDGEMAKLFWPVIIAKGRDMVKLLHQTNEYYGDDLDNVIKAGHVYSGRDARFNFTATDNAPDELFIPTWDGKRQPSAEEKKELSGILPMIRSLKGDRKLFESIYDEWFAERYRRIKVPEAEIESIKQKMVSDLLDESYLDVVMGQTHVLEEDGTVASPRSNVSQKINYGKKYSVWLGEGFLQLMRYMKNGKDFIAWTMLEEARHFSEKGVYKSDYKDGEDYKVYGDHLKRTGHGSTQHKRISTITYMIDQAALLCPTYLEGLRNGDETQMSPVARALIMSTRMCFETDLFSRLENIDLSLDDAELIILEYLKPIYFKYFNGDDQVATLFDEVTGTLKGYSLDIAKSMRTGYRYEKFGMVVLKSA